MYFKYFLTAIVTIYQELCILLAFIIATNHRAISGKIMWLSTRQ